MAMTLAEKILAAHAGLKHVSPGDLIEARVDMVLANDITAPLAIGQFQRLNVPGLFDRQRVALVQDHFVPPKDIAAANQCKLVRSFAREHGLAHYYEAGKTGGIEHVVLPEQGVVLPGEVVIGADSHTCTYGALGAFSTGMGSTDVAVAMATGRIWMKVPETIRFIYEGGLQPWVGAKDLILYTIGDIGVEGALYQAMEFGGPVIDAMGMDGRFTMANMAVEAGAKAGLFAVDDTTLDYVRRRTGRPFTVYHGDPDAQCALVRQYDVSEIEPQVAFPHLPSNTRPVSQAGHVSIDQVFIGSCTNGRISDLRLAARVLGGRQVDSQVRCIIIPGDATAYRQALAEGLIETFVEAGAMVGTPSCGPCLGGHSGVLGEGERCISTTNRNFVGRMGHVKSEVYLANPAVAAASAILGRIAAPAEL
ncbi:MAG: 3-isopropylmalate dehydratase large subunit [Chloroflexi bacterium]|nr:3-isopropylmalate dehydratase large subunit [Chloroflexota bacterium]